MSRPENPITRGDVESGIHATLTGGFVLWFDVESGAFEEAAVGQVMTNRINPFQSGQRKCVLDWHVIGTVVFGQGRNRQQTVELSEAMSTEFVLDGVSLEVKRSPVLPNLAGDGGTDWGFSEGSLVQPDELAVGRHELTSRFFFEGELRHEFEIDFLIDPPESDTCSG